MKFFMSPFSQIKPYLFSDWFEPPLETLKLWKSDGLVHCSM